MRKQQEALECVEAYQKDHNLTMVENYDPSRLIRIQWKTHYETFPEMFSSLERTAEIEVEYLSWAFLDYLNDQGNRYMLTFPRLRRAVKRQTNDSSSHEWGLVNYVLKKLKERLLGWFIPERSINWKEHYRLLTLHGRPNLFSL